MNPPELHLDSTEQFVTHELVDGPVIVEVVGEAEPVIEQVDAPETALEAILAPTEADLAYADAFTPPAVATDFLSLPEPPTDYWAGVAEQQARFYLATTGATQPATVPATLPYAIERVGRIEAQARKL